MRVYYMITQIETFVKLMGRWFRVSNFCINKELSTLSHAIFLNTNEKQFIFSR